MKTLLLTLILSSCSYWNKSEVAQASYGERLSEVLEKRDLYKKLGSTDEDGWILTDECDALLHSSLATLNGSVDYAKLARAKDLDGRWWRRPSRDCLSTGSSKSSISRDMLLGLLLAISEHEDFEAIKDLIDYADYHNFVMGEHDGSIDGKNRVLITPTFYLLMKSLKEHLEGTQSLSNRLIESEVDFTDHLAVLSMILKGSINNAISPADLDKIKDLTERDPNNALYWAVRSRFEDGDQSEAISILLRDDLFPNDRLPNESDRRVPYLWMHGEKDSDWAPGSGDKEHPGHDLTFVVWVMTTERLGGVRD